MDDEIVIIKVYRNTRRKLKLIAALEGVTSQDLIKDVVDKIYIKSISKAQIK